MAYRNPKFYTAHMFRLSPALVASDFAVGTPLGLLYDGKQKQLFRFAGAELFHALQVTGLPAGHLADTVIIPDGHNINGDNIVLEHSAGAFPGTSVLNEVVPAGLYISSQWVAVADAGWRVSIGPNNSTQWHLGEFVITLERELVRGPVVSWSQGNLANLFRSETQAGIASSRVLGATRLTWRATWDQMNESDVAQVLDMLEDIGGAAFPFYFLPPDTRFNLGLYEMERPVTTLIATSLTAAGSPRYRMTLDLVEALG